MSKVEYFVTPGDGERNLELFHFSQGVKIGDRVEISGQGGWSEDWEFPASLVDEIAQAFRNVERVLALAGATWDHVVDVHSYHVDLDPEVVVPAMAERFRHYRPGQPPIWTCIGVATLADPKMRVEVRVTAILPD